MSVGFLNDMVSFAEAWYAWELAGSLFSTGRLGKMSCTYTAVKKTIGQDITVLMTLAFSRRSEERGCPDSRR